jgi:hypothetical protein
MLYEKDIFGTEGHTKSPQEEEELEADWLKDIMEGIEDGLLTVTVNQRDRTISVIEKDTGETMFHASIEEYAKLQQDRKISFKSPNFKSKKEN